VLQHQLNKSLRTENQALLAQNSQLPALRAENERLANRASVAASNSLSDEQQQELNRLRGEVARLRSEATQAAKLREELNRLRSGQRPAPNQNAMPQDNFPREAWAFAGYATPESAIQSMAWAALQGDVNTFLNSMSADQQSQERGRWQKNGKNETQIRSELTKEFGGTKAIRIDGRQTVSDSEVIFSLFIERDDGHSERANLKLKRMDDQWKLAGVQGPNESVEVVK
jgi:hypothetical protein